MTFAEAAAEKTVSPIIVLEIADESALSLFGYYEAGIAVVGLQWTGTDLSFLSAGGYNTSERDIASVVVTQTSGGAEDTYTEVTSIANLRSQNKSWYFDSATQNLYIHFDSFLPWWYFYSVELGLSSGYSDKGYNSGLTYYPPYIESEIKLSEKVDSDFYGIDKYVPIDIDLLNDGSLDGLAQSDLYGKQAIIYLGFEGLDNGFDDFEKIKVGIIESIPTVRKDTVTITLNDPRKFLSRKVPINRVTKTDYANLSDDDDNRPKPLPFGDIRGAEPICLNSEEGSPASYTFLLGDTEDYSLDSTQPTVYVNGASTAITAYTPASGTFTMAPANYDPESDDIWVNFKGIYDGELIEKGTDIIELLLSQFLNIEYISDNYDQAQWATATSAVYEVCYYIDEEISVADVCQEIAQSCRGFFKQTRAGLWTFLFEDNSAAVSDTIYKEDILNDVTAEYDTSRYISSGVVKYSPHWASGKFLRIVEDDYESAAYQKYKRYRSREWETIISNETDAVDFGDKLVSKYDEIVPEFKVRTSLQFIALNLFDTVNVEIERINTTWYGTVKCVILGIDIWPAKGLMEFRLRYIEDA